MIEWTGAFWHAGFQAFKWLLVWATVTGSGPIIIWQLQLIWR